MRRIAVLLCLLVTAAPAPAASVIIARGQWAALDQGHSCQATGRAQRIATGRQVQAIAGWAFDAGGPRHGQFFARLSRPLRAGATAILHVGERPFLLVVRGGWAWSRGAAQDSAILQAARTAGGMRVAARDAGGRRFSDRYLLAGAATAIDAAAAHCATKLENARRRT